MNIGEIISLQRRGNQAKIIDSLDDISLKSENYMEKQLEYIIALLEISDFDKAFHVILDLKPPSSVIYKIYLDFVRYYISRVRKNFAEPFNINWDQIELGELNNLEKRYLGFTLKGIYMIKTKNLSDDRKKILDLLKKVENPFFIKEEWKHITYRDRWYKKEFEGIIKDFTQLRDNCITREHYYYAIIYQNCIHLAHRPLVKGDPEKIQLILDLMDYTLELNKHLMPNQKFILVTVEHKTRFLGLLGKHEEAKKFIEETIPTIKDGYSKYLRSVDEAIGNYHYWGQRWLKAITNFKKCLEFDLPEVRYLRILFKLDKSYYFHGDIVKSIEIMEEYSDIIDSQAHRSMVRRRLAYLNGKLGRYNLAEKLYVSELQNYENRELTKPEIDTYMNTLLGYLIILADQGSLQEAEINFKKMQEIKNNHDYHFQKHLIQIHGIADGIIKKNKARARDKIEALEIFKTLYGDKGGDEEYRRLIMINYCELLLLELDKFGEEEVMDLVIEVTSDILALGESQNSLLLQIEALLLQAKLHTINTEFDKSEKLYSQAKEISKDNPLLLKLVNEAEEEFLSNLTELKQKAEISGSLSNKIEQHNLKNYFFMAKQLMNEKE